MTDIAASPWGVVREPTMGENAPTPPVEAPPIPARKGVVRFLGSRTALLWILLRGYLFTLLTVGIYRFWLVTQKRRLYWSNTVIDGHPLEYTGRSLQLLIGFLLAVLIFVPIYGLVFYLTAVYPTVAPLAYLGLGLLLYFLAGYAAYRGRRFRFTRTLWRGIRFQQSGSAWSYAFRRLGWSALTVLSAGLIYPFMVASLYRYRFSNTWFGDRQFTFGATWKTIVGPFYKMLAVNFAALFAAIFMTALFPWRMAEGTMTPSGASIMAWGAALLILGLSIPWYKARERTRLYSSISVGSALVRVHIRARTLFLQYFAYGAAVFAYNAALIAIVTLIVANINSDGPGNLLESASLLGGQGVGAVILAGLGYLITIAGYALLWELIIGFGYWKAVAQGAEIENIDSLRTVRAQGNESPNLGEGLADALNVGAY